MTDNAGGATAALPQRKARTRAHSVANYILVLLGTFALSIWWLARMLYCNTSGSERRLGPMLCSSHRAEYLVIPAGLVVFILLLIELHHSHRDVVKRDFLHPARAVIRGYWSVDGWEFVHMNASVLLIFILMGVYIYLRFFSDWLF